MKKIGQKIEEKVQKLPRYFQLMAGLFLLLNVAAYLAMQEIADVLTSSELNAKAEVAKLSAHDFTSYSNTVFFLDTAKNLMMLAFIVAVVTIVLQLLIKFKQKLSQLLSVLLVSLFVGAAFLVISSLVFGFEIQFLVFALAFGGTLATLRYTELNKRLTAYEMGERVY